MLVVALCVAVGQIGKTGFARNDEHSANSMARDAMVAVTEVITHTSDAKVHDAAYLALANIALGTAGLATQFIEFLQASAKTVTKKQIDVHFRIGEALATALGRFKCALVRVGWMFPIDPIAVYGSGELEANGAAIDMLLELVTSKMASSPSPQDRQAAVVWILSLVQFCPKLAQLTPWLGKLHTCLCALLTDRDEFTQEAASKTLGLVYDMGDASLKESLVYSLMSLFGGGGGSSGQGPETGGGSNTQQSVRNRIESDEPLLEQETLGQTPDGRAVNTTYKSILSLASDMQNPSLVYQFMQLASHTAIWSSRRGAAYGFATIIERARESMQPYMKAIVPKLYRYTFDPSPQTRAAMTSIWRALLGSGGLPAEGASAARSSSVPAVSSSAEDATLPAVAVATTPGGDEWATSGTSVIEAHWEAIMDECLSSMGQREWRVRESGCSALAGAIRGANAELVVPYLEKIWQMAFRALDDIKGSVRESGLKTCQALATATVAWCTPRIPREPQRDKRAQAVLAVVVPFLVDKGVVSDAEDVRGFSLGLLLKLCKSSGSYLASSVPIIAERLLESLSSMESQAANYLTFHAESNNITQEQLEAVRLSAVKASPIMQGIELVLDQLTPESMGELVPRLQNLIRRGLGLPTRAGCARAVVMLCVKREALLRPHASALVKAISGSLTEASAVQRQAWAAAIGYMAPMLAPGMFKNLLKHLERTYIDKYESEVRGVCGQAVEQLALRCPERLREHVRGAGAMSFVLLGSWDPSEPIREAFRSAWQEYTLGSGTRLIEENLADVLALPMKYIAGDSWPRRVQSANAIADIAQTLERAGRAAAAAATARGDGAMAGAGGSLGALAELVLPELVKASQGRVWPGKGHVLECLVKVCTVNARLFAEGWLADTPRLVCDVLLKEMGRGDLAYRRVAITHFSSLVEALPLDIYAEAAAVLLDIIQHSMSGSVGGGGSSGGANAMAVDEDEPMQRPQQLMLIAAAVKALLLSLPATRLVSEDEAAQSAAVLREIALAGVWNIRVASLECLGALYRHCTAPSVPAANRLSRLLAMDTARVVEAVRACAAEGKYVAVRTAALGALEAVLGGVHGDDAWGAEASAILELLALDPIPSIADRAKEVRAGLGRRG
ncbi:proteasome component M29 [Coemansia sp. RSA 2320]|nr:proteasome component M29 [Coemansia sp. RSA 2320]